MRRLTSIFLALALLVCTLASWQVIRCVGQPCGSGTRIECSAGKSYSKSSSPQNHCGQKPGSATTCCLCFGNCCYYLVPAFDFQLRAIGKEGTEKPQGLQNRYPQLFYHSVWHPPAPTVKQHTIPKNTIPSNFKFQQREK